MNSIISVSRASLVLVLLALIGACATAGANGEQQPRTRTNPNLITEAELQEVPVSTLYEAVERLRPRWLTVRTPRSFGAETQIVVYQNQTQLGGLDVLRQLSKDAAISLQYMDGPTASASLPGLSGRIVEGAIVIRTSVRGGS